MSTETFCPNCGTPRTLGARFCASCGQAFLSGEAGPAGTLSPPGSDAATAALLGGLSWLVTAALTAYLAFQQWDLSRTLSVLGLSDEGLGAYAAVNAITGLITLFFGARLLTGPSRGLLGTSIAWSILSVLGGVAQLTGGTGNDIFALGIIAAAAAGVLSYVARQALPIANERICVHCGKAVASDREKLCNHCGLPLALADPKTQQVVASLPSAPSRR